MQLEAGENTKKYFFRIDYKASAIAGFPEISFKEGIYDKVNYF